MIDKGQMMSYKVDRWTVESGRSSGGALPRRPSWEAGKSLVNVGKGEKALMASHLTWCEKDRPVLRLRRLECDAMQQCYTIATNVYN